MSSPFANLVNEEENVVASNVDESLFDEIVEVDDPTADSDLAGRPPEAGIYLLRYELGDKGVIKTVSKKQIPYVQLYIQAEIVDEGNEYHGYKVFYPSPIMSLRFGNRPTTPLHSFLNKIGFPVPMVEGENGKRNMTVKELADFTEQVLQGKPMGKAELDWKVSYKTVNKEGNTDYIDQITGMENFPTNEETGEYEYLVASDKDGSTIAAQIYIKKFLQQ